MRRFRVAFGFLVIAAVLMFVAARTGGVRVIRAEGVSVYRHSISTTILSGLAALMSLAATGLIATARIGVLRWFAALSGLLGVLLAVACADSAVTRVVVRRRELELPGVGMVWRPVERVSVDELQAVVIRRQKRELEFTRKDGRTVRLPEGDLVRAAMPEIDEVLLEVRVVVGRF
jgi:hypothetical protein